MKKKIQKILIKINNDKNSKSVLYIDMVNNISCSHKKRKYIYNWSKKYNSKRKAEKKKKMENIQLNKLGQNGI